MVHIIQNWKPMGKQYQFSTRREAFSIMLQLEREHPKDAFAIVQGKVPKS